MILVFFIKATFFHASITHFNKCAFTIRILKLHFVLITSFASDRVNQSAILFFVWAKNTHAEDLTHSITSIGLPYRSQS